MNHKIIDILPLAFFYKAFLGHIKTFRCMSLAQQLCFCSCGGKPRQHFRNYQFLSASISYVDYF